MNINTTVKAFLTVLATSNTIDQNRTKALEEKALLVNNGLAPTRDSDGRLHAPVNGYVWGEDVYHGGSYLSEEYDSKHVQNNKTRFKATLATVEELKLVLGKFLTISNGTTWSDSGEEVTYCYVTGLSNTQYTQINALIVELEKDLKKELLSKRSTMEEGKKELTLQVVSSFTKYNSFTGTRDLKLELTDTNNVNITCSVTSKMWDLVENSIDELLNKTIIMKGTVKAIGEKQYQLVRPSKIKLA